MAKRVFKSKKKLSSVRAVYRKWSEWETGDIIVGKYKGSQIDNYDKPNWLIEVEEAFFGDKKEQKKVIGQVMGLNSSGKLDAAMKKVEIGEMVQIEYKGMSTIEKGKFKGKDAHDIDVDLVEEDGGDDDEEEIDEDEDEVDEDEEDDL